MRKSSEQAEASALTTSWVAARFGLDPVGVNARRRAGELYAFRPQGASDWLYPAWQFEGNGVRPAAARFFAAARDQGLGPAELHEILSRRVGIVGGRGVPELLLSDRPERALAALPQPVD